LFYYSPIPTRPHHQHTFDSDSHGGSNEQRRKQKSYQFIEHVCDFITISRELPPRNVVKLSLSMIIELSGNEPSAHARMELLLVFA
jgi:hypothetical protein